MQCIAHGAGTEAWRCVQYVTVRNGRGKEMLEAVRPHLKILPTVSTGDRKPFVLQTVIADDECATRPSHIAWPLTWTYCRILIL